MQSDATFAISSDISQKVRSCAAVPILNDNILEGDECLSVSISAWIKDEVTVVDGAETVKVIIEDDEGIYLLWYTHHACWRIIL